MTPGAGAAVHPVLVVSPVALLIAGFLFDVVHQLTDDTTFSRIAFWLIGAGLVGGALVALIGLMRWSVVLADPDVTPVDRRRGALTTVLLAAFAISWLIRVARPDRAADGVLILLEVLALAHAALAAGRDGSLVEQHVVALDPDARDAGTGAADQRARGLISHYRVAPFTRR